MDQLNLEAIDVDGAIREGAEEVAGDTRLSFLRKGALAGGAVVGGGAILSGLIPSLAGAKGAPPTSFGKGDIGILNFALTLEYLERAFYNEATQRARSPTPRRGVPAGPSPRTSARMSRSSRRVSARPPSRSRSSTSTAPPAT